LIIQLRVDADDIINGERPRLSQPSIELSILGQNFANSFFQVCVSRQLLIQALSDELLDRYATLARDGFGRHRDIVWKL